MNLWRLIGVFLLAFICQSPFVSSLAFAEDGCPPNLFPYKSGCASQYEIELDIIHNMPPKPLIPLKDSHWGAIAIDANKLHVNEKELKFIGVSQMHKSMKQAEKAALKMCKSDGSNNCKIVASVPNQCLSISISKTNSKGLEYFFAPTIEYAQQISMLKCNRNFGECINAYIGCSYKDF